MIVVYRRLHCPIYKTYTAKIEAFKDKFDELEIDIVFISGGTKEKANNFAREVGLYISETPPNGTGRSFQEPGLFVFNENGQPHILKISKAPFIRPKPELIIRGTMQIKNIIIQFVER